MICPKCHSDCPPEFDFCPHCAAPLVVTCPHCGFRAPADYRFCPKCATPLTPTPATPSLPDERTEGLLRQVPKEYAERLLATRGQPHDERRTVTILFSDIKGSTAMISQLDPEDAKEVIQGAFEFLIAPIYRYEGTLVQLMGDAILAFFGAPIAHEDDPERACRAALDITAEAAQYAEKLEKESGISGFNVRVGINTGLVVVGEVGSDLRVAYTAVGNAINLAARMEQNAEAGTVLVTEATFRLVAPLFETQAMPPLQVKGKAEPVSTYRVLAAKAEAGKVRGIAGLESPLVGREAEIAALRGALERLRAGVGGIVTIVGEAGLGKSRLVAELRHCHSERSEESRGPTGSVLASPPSVLASEAKQSPAPTARDSFARVAPRPVSGRQDRGNDKDVQWVEGRCLSYGSSIAYLLWLDVLRDLLAGTMRQRPLAEDQALRQQAHQLCPDRFPRIYPYLAHLLSLPLTTEERTTVDNLDGEKLKAATFHAVRTLVRCAANDRPLAMVCEDLHWADPTSLELLEHLLSLTRSAPLLFICVLRPDERHGSWQIRAEAARSYRDTHVDLVLEPLSGPQGRQLLDNMMGAEGFPAKLRDRVLSRAEGNPFYVEEIIRSLLGAGAIRQDGDTGRWDLTQEVANIAIPDTLQGVLMSRIDRLQENTKRVLQQASVIGRIFLYRVLQSIAFAETAPQSPAACQQEPHLVEHLSALQREEMIRERARTPELEYIFKHDLTREAAYRSLLKKERRVFHRQVAEALERLFPERFEEQLGVLAYHWEQSGDLEKATQYLLRAGDKARLAYAHQEAIGYYQRAQTMLQGLGDSVDERWLAVEEGLGDVRAVIGEHEPALANYRRARELAAAIAAPAERLAGLCRKTAMLYERKGQYATALQWLAQGLDILRGEPTLETARIRLAGAGVYSRQGQHRHALEWCQWGLDIAQKWNASAELAHGTYLLGTIHGHLGHSAEEIACARQSLALYEGIGDLAGQANALNNLGIACKEAGDWDAAVDCFQRALELEQELGNVHDIAKLNNNLGNVLFLRGQLDAAAQAYHKSLDLWTGIDFPLGVALSLSNLGEVGAEQGQWAAALDNLQRSERLFRQIESQHFIPEVQRRLATVYVGLARWHDAQRSAESSVALAGELDMELEKALSLRVLGQVYLAQGRFRQAEEALTSSLSVLEEQGNRFGIGQTLYQLGCLYRAQAEQGDTVASEKARAAFERAQTTFAELGAQRELCKVREGVRWTHDTGA